MLAPNSTLPCEVPQIFHNCTRHFRCDRDEKYSQCTLDAEEDRDECKMLEWLHLAKDFRRYVFAIVPLILSFLVILLNALFVWLVFSLIVYNRKGSRKRYAFLINRSVCTIIAMFLFYVVLFAWKFDSFNYISATVFIGVAMLLFFNLAGTYLAMTSLLYAAVIYPLYYRTHVTMTHSLLIIAVIWIFAGGASLIIASLGCTLFYPETALIQCDYRTCQWPTMLCLTILLCLLYVSVIIAYALMVLRVHMRNPARISPLRNLTTVNWLRGTDGDEKQQAFRLTQDADSYSAAMRQNVLLMQRLAWNLLTFTASKCPMLVILIVAIVNLDELRKLGIGPKNFCKTYNNGRMFFHVELLASSAANLWLLVMLFDPLINIVNDPPLWAFVRRYVRLFVEKARFLLNCKQLPTTRWAFSSSRRTEEMSTSNAATAENNTVYSHHARNHNNNSEQQSAISSAAEF